MDLQHGIERNTITTKVTERTQTSSTNFFRLTEKALSQTKWTQQQNTITSHSQMSVSCIEGFVSHSSCKWHYFRDVEPIYLPATWSIFLSYYGNCLSMFSTLPVKQATARTSWYTSISTYYMVCYGVTLDVILFLYYCGSSSRSMDHADDSQIHGSRRFQLTRTYKHASQHAIHDDVVEWMHPNGRQLNLTNTEILGSATSRLRCSLTPCCNTHNHQDYLL